MPLVVQCLDSRYRRPVTLLPGPIEGATAVTVWTLQMGDLAELRPAAVPSRVPLLMPAARPAPELSRFFYGLVGAPWHWVDRVGWSAAQWRSWVDRPEFELCTAWLDGVPLGYFELEQVNSDVEVAYFGLVPGAVGQGFGGWLLTRALTNAWQRAGARRVWVHTCSLDGPAALANYQARGMRTVDERREWRAVPIRPAGDPPEPPIGARPPGRSGHGQRPPTETACR